MLGDEQKNNMAVTFFMNPVITVPWNHYSTNLFMEGIISCGTAA
jgi:hypothetical protein